MSWLNRKFDESRASEAGSMYAKRYPGRTRAWLLLEAWGGWIAVGAVALFLYHYGK